MNNVEIILQSGVTMPQYQTDEAAGLDLCLAIQSDVRLYPGQVFKAGTGVSLNINDVNVAVQLMMRSGWSKLGLMLTNSVGLVDSDYTGEIFLSLVNRSENMLTLRPGDRVAQMVFVPVLRPQLVSVTEFSRRTDRGAGGFGHTGGTYSD